MKALYKMGASKTGVDGKAIRKKVANKLRRAADKKAVAQD